MRTGDTVRTDVASGLAAHLGSLPVADGSERPRWRIGGIEPEVVAFPRSVEELAELLGRASEEGWRVMPAGRGRWVEGGGLPTGVDVLVSTKEMTRVVEYVPDDLTLTAEAGLDLGTLAETTRAQGQWLALDPPAWRDSTLGALVATGVPGPLVAGFGRPRDHLLGLTTVTGDGRILRPGGRVVKNVAGYDLVRLMAGSWGTLGVVASVTVRLFPLPSTEVTLLFSGADPFALVERARALATASVVPEALELVWWPSGGGESRIEVPPDRGGRPSWSPEPGGGTLVARILGSPDEVQEKARILRRAASDDEALRVEGEASRSFHEGLAEEAGGGTGALALRLSALPARLADLLGVVGDLRGRGVDEGGRVWTSASVTRGTVSMQITPPPSLRGASGGGFSPEAWGPLLESARESLSGMDGSLTILRGPRALLDVVAARRPGASAHVLMEGIRRALDPAGVLVPGRMEPGSGPVEDPSIEDGPVTRRDEGP